MKLKKYDRNTALKYVENTLKKVIKNPIDLERGKTDFALKKLRGIDFNPDLVRVSKMRMILEEDGHTGVFHANSLEKLDKIKENAKNAGAINVEAGTIDVILTNPPFGKKGTVTDKEILKQFNLGKQWVRKDSLLQQTEKILDEQVPDILFLERCHQFLKDKGKMAIVLPDGILSGPKVQYVRQYLFSHFKVIGIISLPYSTFIPHGANVKASILLLQKLNKKSLEKLNKEGYNTFMADIEKIGYQGNKSGTLIYKINEFGDFILDEDGNKVLDEDISEVLESWDDYVTNNKAWV
jgi:type I restriction enzyme M protein